MAIEKFRSKPNWITGRTYPIESYTGIDIPDIRMSIGCEYDCIFLKGDPVVEITQQWIGKIDSGEYVITEYVKTPLYGMFYLEPNDKLN